MIKPTKKQRSAIYKEALLLLETGKEEFMCNAIATAYDKLLYGCYTEFLSDDIVELFPEFIAERPDDIIEPSIWFTKSKHGSVERCNELRIETMKKIINEI